MTVSTIWRMCAVHLPPPAALDTVTWKRSKNYTILPRQPSHRTPLLIHCNTLSNFRSALTDGCISHTSTAWRWCLFSQYSNSKSSAELYLLQKETVSGIKHWRCGQRHNSSGRDFSFNSMICESPQLKIAASSRQLDFIRTCPLSHHLHMSPEAPPPNWTRIRSERWWVMKFWSSKQLDR